MKARAFIGSSVEGLSVAYPVQQNLLHDAETTVWDQGVFELSATTIESLTNALSATDFGIFVFTPDDIVRMRGAESPSVRDNVLFEMGLFIGKLGRERVFFLVPSEPDIHIPTDLLGVTPAKYETTRTDGSMQAATGPACHQIRTQIKKLGSISTQTPTPGTPEESDKVEPEKKLWIQDFVDEKYASAKATLEAALPTEAGEKAIASQAWIYYCDFKQDEKIGLEKLYKFSRSNPESPATQIMVASILLSERYTEQAMKLLNEAKKKFPNYPEIDVALSECHVINEDPEAAITILRGASPTSAPSVAMALASILESQERRPDAIEVVHACYMANPRNNDLRYKYARIALELGMFSIALYFLDDLTRENPKSIDYWGYLGNCCLSLGLDDHALAAYRRAESQVKSDDSNQWIISNIGNLFSNKGLPTEACVYLERAVTKEPRSEYAHERLARSLKSKGEQLNEYQKKCSEGFRLVKNTEAKRRQLASSVEGDKAPT